MTFSQINVGTGELETYPDITKGLTPEMIQDAAVQEEYILKAMQAVELVYYQVGDLLKDFRDRELYRARGYTSFRQWADSPELARMSYDTAQYLIRIVTELRPILDEHQIDINEYPVSVARAMLPMVTDGNPDKVIEAAYEVKDKTVKDAKAIIRELRGIEGSQMEPTIFKLNVELADDGMSHHKGTIMCHRPDGTFYEAGRVLIKPEDFARFEALFGRHVEIV